ncbi:hypothetical protein ACWD35_45100, partial [Streptomyces sp. NPDC002671]
LPVTPVGAGGVVDGAAGDVEDLLPVVGQQRDRLKNWRVLGKVRTDPKWATALVRALLVLTNREVAR